MQRGCHELAVTTKYESEHQHSAIETVGIPSLRVAGTMGNCTLCSALNHPTERWNQPLFESENFVAIPSLGSLVPGWLLIVPRSHSLSIGQMSARLLSEFDSFRVQIWREVESKYGSASAFEHGAAAEGRLVGCGVDHTHVHVVPLSFSLVAAARPHLPENTAWVEAKWADCRRVAKQGLDYLFVEQPLGCGRLTMGTAMGSQILRKAIAATLGNHIEFDWRKNPGHQVIDETIQAMSTVARQLLTT